MSVADRQAKEVKNKYIRKFMNLDNMFAAEIIGDGVGTVEGPFGRAHSSFHTNQIILLCARWFGEINNGMDVVLKEPAGLAAAGELGLSISPLANTNNKGGVYLIM